MKQNFFEKRIFFSFLFVGSLLLLSGCETKEDKNENGGVDGSGGMLSYITEASFDDWVKTDHQFYVRDTVHRFLLKQSRFHEDIEEVDHLTQKLIGESPEDFRRLVESVQYYSVRGSCPGSTHPQNDASVTPDRKVCFSYQAFKNIPVHEGIRKLVAMSIHEISHLRGFDESEAEKLQLLFEKGPFGEEMILAGNRSYQAVHRAFKNIADDLNDAMKWTLFRGARQHILACQSIATAVSRKIEAAGPESDLPLYLQNFISDHLENPLIELNASCLDISQKEFGKQLANLMGETQKIDLEILNYESPSCQVDSCEHRMVFTRNSELTTWNLLKRYFLADQPYPQTNASDVSCHLKDLTNNRQISLERKSDSFQIVDADAKKDLNKIFLNPVMPYKSMVKFDLYFLPLPSTEYHLQFMNGEGLKPTTEIGDKRYLLKGVQEKLSVKFALLKAPVFQIPYPFLEQDEKNSDTKIPYFQFDPVFTVIYSLPTPEREYQLDCELTP